MCTVNVYGLSLRSQWPIHCPEKSTSEPPQVELFEGSAALFRQAAREAGIALETDQWFHHARLPDGSDYLRWSSLFEFMVSSDGRRIGARPITDVPREAFQTYLLGQVLSYALLKMGMEPLHATVLVVDGWAVALLGASGRGKSTLGAAFLKAGHQLLTDDLLVLKKEADGFSAYPGLPRIKLFPEVAKAFLGEAAGTPMNPQTTKLVIPLKPGHVAQAVSPLKAIYVLRPPTAQARSKRVAIRPLRPCKAVVKLVGSTFNTVIRSPDRLARQFLQAAKLAARIPVKSLGYPRDLAQLPLVVETVRSELP